MTTGEVRFEVEQRRSFGKKNKALRRRGLTPVHLYGRGIAPLSLQGDALQLERLVAQAGHNTPVSLGIRDQETSHFTFIREVQRDPVTEQLLHVDFLQVSMTETMRAEVPIELTGEPAAVRIQGGILYQSTYAVSVECLPLDLPNSVQLDVSHLEDFEQTITVADIDLGDKVSILSDPEELIARVHAPRVAAEEAEAVEEPRAEEEEAAEGESSGE